MKTAPSAPLTSSFSFDTPARTRQNASLPGFRPPRSAITIPGAGLLLPLLLTCGMATAADPWKPAEGLLDEGSWEEAAAAFSKVIPKRPAEARGYTGRGRARLALSDWDGAIADYTKAITLLPRKQAYVFSNRGVAYSSKGQTEPAMRDYDQALQLNPKDAATYFNRGREWCKREQWEKGLADYQKVVGLNPKFSMAYHERAIVFTRLGECDKALAACDKAIQVDDSDSYAWLLRALTHDSMGEDDKARDEFDKAVELGPEVARNHNDRGFFLLNLGDADAALAGFDKAIELDPSTAVYVENRGLAWQAKGDPQQALAAFDKAIALDPEAAGSYAHRARCWLSLDQPEKAIADATRSIELDALASPPFRVRGEAREATGDLKGAKEDFARASVLGPQPLYGVAAMVPPAIIAREIAAMKSVLDDETPKTRARLAAARHEYAFAILDHPERAPDQAALEEAVAYARSATVLEPAHAGHWFLTGLLYHELSAGDERALPMAERMLRKAVEVDEEHAAAWLELGLMMAAQARGMEAITGLENALASHPAATAPDAVGPLCAVYAATDQGGRGVDFFEEQYTANPEVPALGVGLAIMLDHDGDRPAAISQAKDIMLLEDADTPEHQYAAKLVSEWGKEKP